MSYTHEPSVFTVLLNWNGKADTLACLESLGKAPCPNHTVVLVDNGSTDGSQDAVRKAFPHVVLLQNDRNLGFAGGNNIGIDYALERGADFVYLLNNDTVADPGMYGALLDAARAHPEAGIFGAKIYYFEKPTQLWYAGGEWSWERAEFGHRGCDREDNGRDWEKVEPTDFACGCAIFIRAEVLRKIGGLEERYFILWEEADFCYRARRAGFACLFVPGAKVWHKISSTFGKDDKSPRYRYFLWRNRLLWIERNLSLAGKLRVLPCLVMNLGWELRYRFAPRAPEKFRLQSKGALQGIRDYLLRRFYDCPAWLRKRTG
jgi:hypothetical protein